MKNTMYYFCFLFCLILFNVQCSEKESFPVLRGDYLGQKPPGMTPEIFAPGIISTGMAEFCPAFIYDGKELYFVIVANGLSVIVTTKEKNGLWTAPETAPFSGKYADSYPSIHPDGSRLYFASSRPLKDNSGSSAEYNIWFVDREINGWSEPKPIGPPVNGVVGVSGPSVTKDGTMYFTKMFDDYQWIYRSKYVNGIYMEPEKLPDNVNSVDFQFDSFISPDESFLFLPVFGREDSKGSTDLYIAFRDENDSWSDLINLGDKINTGRMQASISLSPDGKYVFYQSEADRFKQFDFPLTYSKIKDIYNNCRNGNADIYWVSAKIIEELKPDELK